MANPTTRLLASGWIAVERVDVLEAYFRLLAIAKLAVASSGTPEDRLAQIERLTVRATAALADALALSDAA